MLSQIELTETIAHYNNEETFFLSVALNVLTVLIMDLPQTLYHSYY